MKNEGWKPIKGYENLYEVSNRGNVRCCGYKTTRARQDGNVFELTVRAHMLSATNNGNGYLMVSLQLNHQRKRFYVHRLVAETFIGVIGENLVINHKDFNKANNAAENLEIVTQKQNCAWSHEHYCKPKKFKNKSGYKHIRHRNGKYIVEVVYHRKFYNGGRYNLLSDAIERREQIYDQINYYR